MPVKEAADGVPLLPNHVYVGPPGARLGVSNGTVEVIETCKRADSATLGIDFFLRSLADDQRERAICVVLSGAGSDGTLGLKAVKAAAGMAMVQDVQSAQYTGMPSSAIATGLADYVLPPGEMPEQLIAYAQGPFLRSGRQDIAAAPAAPLQKILLLLRNRTGQSFSSYKTSTVYRRIGRRMNVQQIQGMEEYARFLEENPHELDVLFKELLISVTSFFRDPEAFAALGVGPLRDLLNSRSDNDRVRAWVPGCATGEEAYSVAMVLHECADAANKHFEFQIFGTDLDSAAIETARSGLYPEGIAVDVRPDRLQRYFVHEDSGYRVCKAIREMAVFAPQNVIQDPPFTKMDLICCRNLLIYLNADMQQRLLPIFHYALRPGGLLMLGPSETVGGAADLFDIVEKTWKVFRRKETALAATLPRIPAESSQTGGEPGADSSSPVSPGQGKYQVAELVEKWLLGRYSPPSVLVNARGEILHIHGRTGAYLEPAAGRPRMNLLDMAREGLQTELAACLRQVASQQTEIVRKNLRVKANGEYTYVHLSVAKIIDPETIRGLILVSFRPAAPPARKGGSKARRWKTAASSHEEQLERQLQETRESLQSTVEELEASNEELKSTNEELQSTNEELQSTNEELETSKEEMQSLNEELSTVNSELQVKVDQLSQANDDMQNLLDSIEVATIFLDEDLRIKRYTESATKIVKLIQTDVGRPIDDLATNLKYDNLDEIAREVLKTLVPREVEVETKDGRYHMMRIMPYRTAKNVVSGLVVTLVDVHKLKTAQQHGENGPELFRGILKELPLPLVLLNHELRVESANLAFCELFRLAPGEVEDRILFRIGDGDWDLPGLRPLLEAVLSQGEKFEKFQVEREFRGVGRKRFLLSGRRLDQDGGAPALILAALHDVTNTT
jgi:two-component system CheB/CheR fusion protein